VINNHTYYSLRYGSLSVEELLEEASKVVHRDESGWGKFALTDINTTSACLDFIRLAPKYNIHPVVGIDFRNGIEQQFVGIAQNNEGFMELNRFLSIHLEQKKNFPSKAPSFENSFVIYPLEKYKGAPLKPWEFVGIKSTQLLSKVMRNNDIPLHRLIAFQTGTFRNKKDFNAHRLLRAIDNNTLLSMLAVEEQATFRDTIEHWDTLVVKFHLYPKLIRNLQFLLETASIQFDFGTPKIKRYLVNRSRVIIYNYKL
jgi:DNA polymerase III alpha subunit